MIVIKRQIEASDQAAHDIAEQLRHDHRQATVATDVDVLVRVVIGQLAELDQTVCRWRDAAGPAVTEPEEHAFAKDIWPVYRQLEAACERVLQLVLAVEAWGYRVDERAAFNRVRRTLRGLNSLSLDRIRSAAAAAKRGELKTLGALRDELRAAARP